MKITYNIKKQQQQIRIHIKYTITNNRHSKLYYREQLLLTQKVNEKVIRTAGRGIVLYMIAIF